MTTLQHTPTASTERRIADRAPPVALPALRAVCIVWNICPRALQAAAHATFAALTTAGVEPASVALELHLDFRARTVRASLRATRSDASSTRIAVPRAAAESSLTLIPDPLNASLNIDAPGIIHATLALDENGGGGQIARVLYAATPILATLGLAGGMCDAPTIG